MYVGAIPIKFLVCVCVFYYNVTCLDGAILVALIASMRVVHVLLETHCANHGQCSLQTCLD